METLWLWVVTQDSNPKMLLWTVPMMERGTDSFAVMVCLGYAAYGIYVSKPDCNGKISNYAP